MSKIILNSIKHPNSASDNLVVNADGTITAVNTIDSGVINVYQHVDRQDRSFGTSGYTDLGVSISLTPTSADSKFLIMCSYYMSHSSGATVNTTIQRKETGEPDVNLSNDLLGDNGSQINFASHHVSVGQFMMPFQISYIDAPNTTNDLEYTLLGVTNQGTGRMNFWAGGGFQGASRMIVMELAGTGGNNNVQ